MSDTPAPEVPPLPSQAVALPDTPPLVPSPEPRVQPVGPTAAAPATFAKLSPDEDANGDGLTEKVSSGFWLWLTDAITVFWRGVLAGLFPAVTVAGTFIAKTDSTETQTIVNQGAMGFAIGLACKGLERFHNWTTQNPAHEMPNPRRPKDQQIP